MQSATCVMNKWNCRNDEARWAMTRSTHNTARRRHQQPCVNTSDWTKPVNLGSGLKTSNINTCINYQKWCKTVNIVQQTSVREYTRDTTIKTFFYRLAYFCMYSFTLPRKASYNHIVTPAVTRCALTNTALTLTASSCTNNM